MSARSIASLPGVGYIRRLVNRAGYDVTGEPFTFHLVRILDRHGITDALDIGANIGQFGTTLRQARFAGRIVSVEPLGSAFRQLRDRIAADAAWTAEHAAVSDTAGQVTINVAGNSVSSSVLPMLPLHSDAAPESRYVAAEQIAATTLDDLVARHGLDPAKTFLKIDVQGYEAAVLDGGAKALRTLAAVQMEMSLGALYDGQVLMPELVARMDAEGFDLWLINPGLREPATGRMLQCDGVFLRRESR